MAKKRKKTSKKTKNTALKAQVIMFFVVVASLVMLSSSVVLFIGMLPTIVIIFIDQSKNKVQAVTVGAVNLTGCLPFLLELWVNGNSFQKAVSIISDPFAIVVMYSLAAIGYFLDWFLTSFIANILYHRGIKRQEVIAARQVELEQRWGKEVTGKIPLDENGFPLEPDAPLVPGKPQESN